MFKMPGRGFQPRLKIELPAAPFFSEKWEIASIADFPL
jgi:hypothetical protein